VKKRLGIKIYYTSEVSTAQALVRIPPFELAVRIINMEKQKPIKLIPKWSVERGKESHSQLPTPKLALRKSASFYVSQGRRRRRKTHKFFE
jgi:hypothetical protein